MASGCSECITCIGRSSGLHIACHCHHHHRCIQAVCDVYNGHTGLWSGVTVYAAHHALRQQTYGGNKRESTDLFKELQKETTENSLRIVVA